MIAESMFENPTRSYDPGFAAGATFRRAVASLTELACEQGLALRIESWATNYFSRTDADAALYRAACREHFRRGFRDGYWGQVRRRERALELELVA